MTDLEYKWTWAENDFLLSQSEGAYDILMMRPDDFLSIAAPAELEESKGVQWLVDKIEAGTTLDLPFINLVHNAGPLLRDKAEPEQERCRAISHEGRHRAEAARRLGIKRIPVIILYEEFFYDGQGRRYTTGVPKEFQRCLECKPTDGGTVCSGKVEQEIWTEWKPGEGIGAEIHGGRTRHISGRVVDR